MFRFFFLVILAIAPLGSSWSLNDNDATCPVVVGEEDLVELWAATGFGRFDMNGPVVNCIGALQNPLLFQGNGIADVVEMALIQSAIEINTPLGGTTARDLYAESAAAFCEDVSSLFSEAGAAFGIISPDSRSLVECAVLGYSASFANPPLWINMTDNPAAGFAYFGPDGDFDGDTTSNLDEWTSALAVVGITSNDVLTYGDAEWGLVWENAKRGGIGGGTALEAYLGGNGLALPHSVDFYALPGAVTAPRAPYAGQVRLATWNLEFFNTRTPPRTSQQLQHLAARLAGFRAAVICLQEISSKDVLEQVLDMMGPSFNAVYWDSQNVIVYDENKVTLDRSQLLSFLAEPPYSTYMTDYPGATQFPFVPPERIPVTAVFHKAGGAEQFRVISFHGHWDSELCREYEGKILRQYVQDLVNNDSETSRIYIMGDYNGWPERAPSLEMEDGELLLDVPSENGSVTHVATVPRIDHVSATPSGMQVISDGSLYVVRPRLFGETAQEFQATYSDHLPLLVEIQPDVQLPLEWWPALLALVAAATATLKMGKANTIS